MWIWYVALVIVGVALLVSEVWLRRRKEQPVDLREAAVSVRVGVLAYSCAGIGQRLVTGLTFWAVQHYVSWRVPITNPLTWVAYIMMDDFVGYWVHRAEHRYRFMWSAHLVHHSVHDLTMANATRLSPIEGFYQPLVNIWAPLLGFPIQMYAPITVISLWLLQLQHTQVVGRLGWLDRWCDTPSNHRVHHGRNKAYLDRNFGGWTMIWDHLFGTYQPEVEPVVYGVTDPVDTTRVVTTSLGGYPALWRDIRTTQGPRAAFQRPVVHA
jgi:sterol desaturase/sphingolipid hydroxylase (fatty acid hydroxylase superfamily)